MATVVNPGEAGGQAPALRRTEPSNVAAGGNDCPVRFRCAGCDHFRTDVSYLPDLTAYLDDLLRTETPITSDFADPVRCG